ncbi:hypothetical protein LXL04_002259 [Taraxacum kok-saghyz]
MSTAGGDESPPYESGEAGEKFCKRPFLPEINEEFQNVSQEAHRNNISGVLKHSTHQGGSCATIGITEVEQMLKQMTYTRSETQQLIALLQSRTIEESSTSISRLEASSTSGSLKKHKHGGESDNFHAAIVSSRVLKEEIGTRKSQAHDSKSIISNATSYPKALMTSPQHPTTIQSLPDELLSNIFIRLLAKQLAQMRSVSKSWNAFLSQPSFVKSHLHRSIHNNDQILLTFYILNDYINPFTTHSCKSPHIELPNFIKLPVSPHPEYTRITVIGSVNGLICSTYGDSIIHIWNPSLSSVLTLPPYSMPSECCNSISNSFRIYFRFGFDPKTDDYKVVKVTSLIKPTFFAKWWMDIEIYSMRKASWNLITERFPSHIKAFNNGDPLCLDGHGGHLHWLGSIDDNRIIPDRIVAFDFGSETFREIPLPVSMLDPNYSCELGVLGQQIYVVSRVGDGTLEVWVMEEYGVVESWVKRHVLSGFFGYSYPFGFTSHTEFLLQDNMDNLALYNLVTNKTQIFKNYPKEGEVEKIVEYVDSLVWVTPDTR